MRWHVRRAASRGVHEHDREGKVPAEPAHGPCRWGRFTRAVAGRLKRRLFGSPLRIGAVSLALLGAMGGAAYATHLALVPDTEGHTTLTQVLTESNDPNYKTLSVQAVNDAYIVRAPATTPAQSGRQTRRRSLAYFAQLTDFQLADEESPARVEFADPAASSAWRPQEAFHPFVIDASIKQINRFDDVSPVPQGDGIRERDGLRPDDRRPSGQRPAQRVPLDPRADRGRHAAERQQRRHRPALLREPRLPHAAELPPLPRLRERERRERRRRGGSPTRASRTTPTTRRLRAPLPPTTTRTPRPGSSPPGRSTRA